jgi:hypothetical protein
MPLYRSTITIDGNKFDAVSTSVGFTTLKDKNGMPVMGSLVTGVKVWIDFHDDTNMPTGTLKSLFSLANLVTQDKLKPMKVEFWKDETKKDALCSYAFTGWISKFETSNPMPDSSPQTNASTVTPYSSINHLLYMELEPVLNQKSIGDITISN